MVWQDIVITIANLAFTCSIINQVIYGFRKKKGLITLATSGLTAVSLFIMSIAFFTLTLLFSGITCVINGVLWSILFFQRLRYKKV